MEHLSDDELLRLLAAARDARKRDWLLVLVTFWHGLRVSETLAITGDAIRDGYLTVQRLKGSNRTTQPLLEHENPLLNERTGLFEYTQTIPGYERLFKVGRKQAHRLIRKYGKLAGIPEHKLHMHVLKHTCAMYFLPRLHINELQQWLGHAKLSSTGEYLKITDEQASAAVLRSLSV